MMKLISCTETHEFIKVNSSYLLCDLSSIIMNLVAFLNAIDNSFPQFGNRMQFAFFNLLHGVTEAG
jgi:hypothetical protein